MPDPYRPTNVIDENDPTANMYGCRPCPKCGSRYRFPLEMSGKLTIQCDDCGFNEVAERIIKER